MLRDAGHGTLFRGAMKKTAEEKARFGGRMIHEGKRHPITLRFERVPGGWYPGGCE